MTDEKTRALIAELREAHEDAGRIPQGTMVNDTQWRPFARLYSAAEAVLDALETLTVPDGDAPERLKAEALKNWQAGVKIRRYSEFFTSFEDGFDRGYAAALSRAAAPEPEWEEPK